MLFTPPIFVFDLVTFLTLRKGQTIFIVYDFVMWLIS